MEEIAHRSDVLDVEDKPLRRSLCNVDSVDGLARKVIDLFEVEYLAFSHLIGREVLAAVTRAYNCSLCVDALSRNSQL